MLSRIYIKLAGAAGIAVLVTAAFLLWAHRGDELVIARAQRTQAVQALSVAQSAALADQRIISALQAQQAVNNAVLAQVGLDESASAATAATTNAQIATSEDGPVAPVLAQTLASLSKAQGERQ